MANNAFIYNGALNGATGGIHERWITSHEQADYVAIRNAIVEFATIIDSMIPTDVTIGISEGALMQSITQGVLAQRYIDINNDFSEVAQAIIALWEVLRGQQEPVDRVTDTDHVINVSTVDPVGGTLSDVLEEIGPARNNEPGYIIRRVFVNPLSTRIGTTFAGVECETSITITDINELGPFNEARIVTVGSGGGGSGGAKNNTGGDSAAAPGGGGGAWIERRYTRRQLIDALPIVMSIGLGGQGGQPVPGTGFSNLVAGTSGNSTTFGSIQGAGAGGGGSGGVITESGGGVGGGIGGVGTIGSTVRNGGAPSANPGETNTGYGGAGADTAAAANVPALLAVWGGAQGANGRSGNTPNGEPGGSAVYGGAGGGSGGGIDNSTITFNGGDGGTSGRFPLVVGGGIAGGIAPGGDGLDGLDGDANHAGDGGSGGASRGSGIGGIGGDGGFPGGGGAGGGTVGGTGVVLRTPGPGGNGADGMILMELI